MKPLRLLNRLSSDDEGMTLIELSVVVALLFIVVGSLLAVLEGTQTNLNRQISRSSSNDEVRLAAQAIDREVRSGQVMYDPATENYPAGDVSPGMSMRVFTQSNQPTRGASCVQWRITNDGELQQRHWARNWQTNPSTLVSGWRVVATGVTNRTEGIAAFARPSPTIANIVNVRFRTNADSTGKKGSTVEVRQSVTGRNTIFATADQACGPAVPDPSLTGTDGTKVPAY